MADTKAELRTMQKRLRAGIEAGDAPQLLAGHAGALIRHCGAAPRSVVAGYWPIQSELSPLALLGELATEGMETCLPVTPRPDTALLFRAWRNGDGLADGLHGTSEPLPDAPEITPDVILVPLLAFDAKGYRLGYGGGFYDRTLKNLAHAKAIGIAYDEQAVEEVPRDEHDMPLHGILTPAGLREAAK